MALTKLITTPHPREDRHRLCQGQSTRPAERNIGLKCLYLHHQSPYLLLGPFQLEIVNDEPFIGAVRGAHTTREMEDIRAAGKGRLRTNPLKFIRSDGTGSAADGQYTALRTSKVVHQHERDEPALLRASFKVALITRFAVIGAR